MVITKEIRNIVANIESLAENDLQEINENIAALISELKLTTSNSATQQRYSNQHKNRDVKLERYPIDKAGYACAFDPLTDEEAFFNTWKKYGIVVGKQVVGSDICDTTVRGICNIVEQISSGKCDISNPSSWSQMPVDSNGIPLLSRGFLEVYHHDILAQIRQAVRIYLHHVVIWGRHDLWTSFDRLGIKLPHHEESKALPLHVDQNPLIHPSFKTIQGVLALADCPVERGTFVGVPGSNQYFHEYTRFAPERGEYVEIPTQDPVHKLLSEFSQPIPLRKGDLITWDSRTAHANSENISDKTRFVAYIAAGISSNDNTELVDARINACKTGIGSNLRDALMHASKKARYTDYDALQNLQGREEKFTLLGELLYGITRY
jgi:hypothetical protein